MLKAKTGEEKTDTLLSKSQIPIIDLAHCGTEETPVKSVVIRVASQLHKALSDKGIAFLVNHGISEEKLKQAWQHLDDFCELPADVKQHYIKGVNECNGYTEPGQELTNETDPEPELRHAFNICTINARNLPEEPLPGFSDQIAGLAKDFKALAGFVLQSLAIGLELPQSFFLENHSRMLDGDLDNVSLLRLLYYPPVVEDDNKCEVMKGQCKYSYQRCASDNPDFQFHDDIRSEDDELAAGNSGLANGSKRTDRDTFTLLAQDSEGGLEVKLPESSKWKRVGHLPGAILIISGEILSVWTDAKYAAVSHRVVVPEQESLKSHGRHSIAFFCHPDNLTSISSADLPNHSSDQENDSKKKRKKSFKIAKDKVYSAYQSIKERFKEKNGS